MLPTAEQKLGKSFDLDVLVDDFAKMKKGVTLFLTEKQFGSFQKLNITTFYNHL